MNPIFNEYIQFLNDTNSSDIDLSALKEGYFWLDKSIIKCFDKSGNEHKIFRVRISQWLDVEVIIPKNGYDNINDIDVASWNDLIQINKQHLMQLEDESLCLIGGKLSKYNDYTPIIPVSMGKDSMVTAHLTRLVKLDVHAIFNNTTLDCSDTYKMAKSFPDCEMMTPPKSFYQYVKTDKMIPTRFARFCCRIFKVGEMVNRLDHDKKYLFFMGMRNEESNTRSNYGDEWVNKAEWGDTQWQGILPIRKWSEIDVWLYTFWRNIEINKKYKKGYSRCGCHIACPFYSKSTWVLDKYWYPKAYKRWRDIVKDDFIENKKWLIMNCTIDEYVTCAWNGGTYRDEPTDEVIKEYAEYNRLDIDTASKYFNKKCKSCGKRIKHKDVLAMNMKLHGKDISKFYCKKCFKKLHNMSEDDWGRYLEAFKQSGCTLF